MKYSKNGLFGSTDHVKQERRFYLNFESETLNIMLFAFLFAKAVVSKLTDIDIYGN